MNIFYSKTKFSFILLATLCFSWLSYGQSTTNQITTAWQAFYQNQRLEAQKQFEIASQNPNTKADAYLGLGLLNWYDEQRDKGFDYMVKFYESSPNPYPYLYSLWSSEVLYGSAKPIQPKHVDFLQRIIKDNKAPGTLRAMAHASLGDYYQKTMNIEAAKAEYQKIGAIDNWAVLGTFENTSGSGFDKDFGVLQNPDLNATYKNKVQAKITWFKPPVERLDKWFDFDQLFDTDNSLMYAQSFVNSPSDQTVYLRAGCSGSMKVWVNDQLVINESTERNCDLDIYTYKITLNKGYNRFLVQIGQSISGRANFMLRLTDDKATPIVGFSSTTQPQAYNKTTKVEEKNLPFFAENFFEDLIKKDAKSVADYVLLASVFNRNDKTYEAKKAIRKAREIMPNSTLISRINTEISIRESNRTELAKDAEFINSNDPTSNFSLTYQLTTAMSKQDYVEAAKVIEESKKYFGVNQATDLGELLIYARQNQMDNLLKAVDKVYKLYPNSYECIQMYCLVQIGVHKNTQAAIDAYKAYLDKNYNLTGIRELAKLYYQNGDKAAALELFKTAIKMAPHEIRRYTDLVNEYYSLADYQNALSLQQKALEFVPYEGSYWQDLGKIYRELNKTQEAIQAYKKALEYSPTLFSAHKALRTLENKSDLFASFSQVNPEEVFKKSPTTKEYPTDNSVILVDNKQRIVYPQGASEERVETIIKVLTQEGIDAWKEYEIPYNSNTQTLEIEKADLLKADGTKTKAETNDNQLVFASLQAGDAIHIVYRLENYTSGMLAGHFSDRFYFNIGYPIVSSNYSLLIHKDRQFQYKTHNFSLEPSIKTVDDFKLYSWVKEKTPAIEAEYYMPPLDDVAQLLEVSTMPSWQFIGDWYSDLVSIKSNSDVEVQDAAKEIFQNQPKNLTTIQKAKLIYEYIEKNVNYLSVAFMQSGLVPQKASQTLNNKLGDCKDVSTLFVALCNEVGIKANLVLVSTRDNGLYGMLLPNIQFNHCIASLEDGGKKYYIELTDNKNPFAAGSYMLRGANILPIPRKDTPVSTTLQQLKEAVPYTDAIVRKTTMDINQRDLTIKIVSKKSGSLSSESRHSNIDLSQEDREKQLTTALSEGFTTPVKVNNLSFENLDNLKDSVITKYSYSVKNQINEVAGMKIFSLPWSEKIATSDFIASETRVFPFELWKINAATLMSEEITLTLPVGKKLAEIPKPVKLSTSFADYEMTYTAISGKVVAKRVLIIKKDQVDAKDYKLFRDFFLQVIEADTKQLAIK